MLCAPVELDFMQLILFSVQMSLVMTTVKNQIKKKAATR